MVKTLTKHGNSHAIVIEKAILELLNIGPDTLLNVSTDGTKLTIEPVTDPARQEKFKTALKKTNRRYGKTLKKLAE